jgi:hypothetical protein
MTEELLNKNYALFLKKLNQFGVNTEQLDSKFGESIKKATYTDKNEHGLAYDGSFIEIILKKLTPYAIKINDLLPQEKQVDKTALVKICLLHQISKAIRFVPNDNQWEREKRLMLYKYNTNNPSIRCGLHSVALCIECGISLTTDEIEAMTVNDRDSTDEQARWHSSMLSTIVRQANELTYMDLNF